MTEWTIFTVVASLAAFLIAMVTPLIKLNTNITRLTCSVESLQKNIDKLTTKNSENHEKLWRHSEAQDKTLSGHETRLTIIEEFQKGDE